MRSSSKLVVVAASILALSGCADGAAPADASKSSSPLTLEEGQYYVLRSTGAIEERHIGRAWGGQSRNSRLFDMGNWWTLRVGGPGADTVSLIHLDILKKLEPGTYQLTRGSVVNSPDSDEPVKLIVINADSQLLNDEDEFEGQLKLDGMSDAGMQGSIDLTIHSDSGTSEVEVVFDVPVVEPLQ